MEENCRFAFELFTPEYLEQQEQNSSTTTEKTNVNEMVYKVEFIFSFLMMKRNYRG